LTNPSDGGEDECMREAVAMQERVSIGAIADGE
jgi:hypothetical protein